MNNERKYLRPLFVMAAMGVGIFIGGKLNFSETPSEKNKLNKLIDYINYEYVDRVDTDSLIDETVNEILEKLDPHSVYIPKDELAEANENMKGDFVGVGISFYMYRDSLAVIRPFEGAPGKKAGIKPGDRLLVVDQDTLFGRGLKSDDIVSKLKGELDSDVELLVYRRGKKELMPLELKRGAVPLKCVDTYYMLTDKLGYIKLNRFAQSSYREFRNALIELQKRGAEEMVLDLRDNPGGIKIMAEQIVDEFLPEGKLILFTKDKNGKGEEIYSTAGGAFEGRQVYVIINENSASASEIVAGALQDHDIGTIVGRRSFGKGLVQSEMTLPDGSAVYLTIARYFTPTGRSIQRPYNNGNDDYYDDFYKRFTSGELSSLDSIETDKALRFTTPGGKTVYGGGGIIPDVFVPIKSTENYETLKYLLHSDFLSFFVFEYLDSDRNLYHGLSPKDFIDSVKISDRIFQRFKAYAYKRGLNTDLTQNSEIVKKYIKAVMARQLYDLNTAGEILNENDPMLITVLEQNAPDEQF